MKKIYLFFFALLLSVGYASADIYYVKTATDGGKDDSDGKGWTTAFATLSKAYGVAVAGDSIWVAQGEYTTASIALSKNNVYIYGSFAGTETDIAQRAKVPGGKEWEFSYPTVLVPSGTRVFELPNVNGRKNVIDGFTFDGKSNVGRRAFYVTGNTGSVNTLYEITKCIVKNFLMAGAVDSGTDGIAMNIRTKAFISYCLITGNASTVATSGTIVYLDNAATVSNCDIIGNTAGSNLFAANAITRGGGRTVQVYNCRIENNVSAAGAILSANQATVYNCLIVNNTSGGPAVAIDRRNVANLYNLTIADNTSTGTGVTGIMFHNGTGSSPQPNDAQVLSNSIVWNNKNANDEVVSFGLGSGNSATADKVRYCIIDGGDYSGISGVTLSDNIITTDRAAIFAGTNNWISNPANTDIVDGGTSSNITLPATDFTGDTRVAGTAIDIGPYEIQDKNITVTVDGNSDVALVSPVSAGTELISFASDYTVTFTTADMPIVTVNGVMVAPTSTGANAYSLTVASVVAPTTEIYISAAPPKVVTVINSTPAGIIITETSATEEVGSPGTYNVAEGLGFTLKFTAEGYDPTVTINTDPSYTLPAPASDGVYTVAIPAVTAATEITLSATIKTFPVTITKGDGIEWSGTVPTDRDVDWNDTYSFAFEVQAGYHLSIVNVNKVYQTQGAPVGNVYTVNLNVKEAKNIVVAAYPDNVVPVREDTYVNGQASTTNFSTAATLLVSPNESTYQRRAYLEFELPADIQSLIENSRIELRLVPTASFTATSFGTSRFEIRTVPTNLPTIANMTWSANSESSTTNGFKGEKIVRLDTLTLTANQPILADITDYIVANKDESSIRLQFTGVYGNAKPSVLFYSKENEAAAGLLNPNYVPQLVLTPNFVIDATGPNSSRSISDYAAGHYGDIIIHSDGENTGQLTGIMADTLVNGVVKLVKTFDSGKWHTIGFPFALSGVKAEGVTTLEIHNQTSDGHGDFWLSKVKADGSGFEPVGATTTEAATAAAFEANKGYILQVPSALNGRAFTFTSIPNPMLKATPAQLAIHENHAEHGYDFTVNPGVTDIIERVNDHFKGHYIPTHHTTATTFTHAGNITTIDLQPFEALLTVAGTHPHALRSSIGGNDDGTTVLITPDANDSLVATKYYNLQGVEIAPPTAKGVYVVKQIYESGNTTTTKQIK